MLKQLVPLQYQPQHAVKPDPAKFLQPEGLFIGSMPGQDLAAQKLFTVASGVVFDHGAAGRSVNFVSSAANGLTRTGVTLVAQTQFVFGGIYTRSGSNAFAELIGEGATVGIGFDGAGGSLAFTKLGVVGLNSITPSGNTSVSYLGSHDQRTGDYWIIACDTLTGENFVIATQTDTNASLAGDGTFTINRNGGANTFAGSQSLGFIGFQYFPLEWGLKNLRNLWRLLEDYRIDVRLITPNTGVTGTFASTLGNDTLVSVGKQTQVGAFASTLGNDTLVAVGGFTPISGTFASTLGGDTMVALGKQTQVGIFAATLGNDTLAAFGISGSSTGTFPPCAIYIGGNIAIGTNGQPIVIIFS